MILLRFPLAIFSFLVYRCFRWLMRRLVNLFYSLRREKAFQWNPLSLPTLRNPLAMPVLMTSAPRWNPHAVIATLGPLPVRASLSIETSALRASTSIWSIVIYTFPAFRTVHTLDSLSSLASDTCLVVELPPGRYWLGLRYYEWSSEAVLPAVSLDGAARVSSLPVPTTLSSLYSTIANKQSWFYLLLHYHVWFLLRYLPSSLLTRHCYLPVGNPGTHFYFGCLLPGSRLIISLESGLLASFLVYVTLYNRASFPLEWTRLTAPGFRSQLITCHGHYLVRVHPLRPADGPPTGIAIINETPLDESQGSVEG